MQQNYPWILKKLRPNISFEWRGEDMTQYENLGKWDEVDGEGEPVTAPTQQECDDAWAGGLDVEYQNEQADKITKADLTKALLTKNFIVAIYKAMKELKQAGHITASPEAIAVLDEIQTILDN